MKISVCALYCIIHLHIALAGSIVGVVRNAQTGKALSFATIRLAESARTTATDTTGMFRFDSLAPGTYALIGSAAEFEPYMRNDIYVPGAGEVRIDLDLVPQILTLDKMVVRSTSFHRAADMSSSTKVINADEILRAPGALVDVQRVVQNLPSVTSGGDNVNEVVVRGGSPGENLLIMDNIEIPNANHFADQHSGGGVVSLINPLLVKGLTFNAGAPPAQYGGKASSVIDVSLRDGNDVIVLGGLDIGMSGAGGHIEGPLWKGSNFMASVHKSYLDFISSFDPTIAVPQFWGLQAKVSQTIAAHKLYANCIYGKNSITINDSKEIGMDYDVIESGGIIYAAGLSWDASWGDRFSSKTVLSGTGNTFDRMNFDPREDTVPADTGFSGSSWVDEQTLKTDYACDLGNNNRLLFGVYGRRAEFSIDQTEKPDTLKNYSIDSINGIPDTTPDGSSIIFQENAQAHETTYKYGGYLSLIMHAFKRLRLVPGVRFDGCVFNKSFTVSPRLNAVLSLNENLDLTSAFGIQNQDPEYVDLAIDPANHRLKPKQALTGIVGLEYYHEPFDVKFVTEGFYKHYNNLLFDAQLLSPDTLDESAKLVDRGEGHTFGIELFAQKKLTKSFFWSAAAALSKSLYQDLRPGHEGEWYSGDYDFRHSFTITGGWKKDLLKSEKYKKNFHDKLWFKLLSPFMPIADRIEISAKWRYLDGRPYTRMAYSKTFRRWYVSPSSELNAHRYAPYHRLDVRFQRYYGFGFLHMIYYIDIQNLYNRDNIWTYLYSDKNGRREPIYQFPFFPVGGIIIGF